jgi:hypothetical protein
VFLVENMSLLTELRFVLGFSTINIPLLTEPLLANLREDLLHAQRISY